MKIVNKFLVMPFLLTGFLSFSQIKNNHPARESFENETSIIHFKKDNSSELSISNKHYQFGKSSLKWEWTKGGFFETSDFRILTKKESPLSYGDFFPASPTLVISLYNEKAQEDTIKISFEKAGKEEVWFPVKLDFTGWRTIRVPFFEMSGNAPKKEDEIAYDTFRVSSSTAKSKGELFFDDIVFSQYMDDRHPYPDVMVPFIKRDRQNGEDHWMPLTRNMQRIYDLSLKSVSETKKKDLALIEKRLDDTFIKDGGKNNNLSKAKEEYARLKLVKSETVLGPPLTFVIDEVYFDKEDVNRKSYNSVSDFGKSLKQIANYYLQSTDENRIEIEDLFITSTRYFLDQGWQEGTSGGTRHHIGYALRELVDAFYMMRAPLKKAGLLNEVGNSLQWVFNLGKVLGPENEFEANIDYFNTQSFYHLKLIFMSDNAEKQAALLDGYSNYISKTLTQNNELGVFKIDGTSWHHGGHYPAYGMGAFASVPQLIFILSGTQFRIDEAGHKNFKKSLLTTRLYSQLLDFGFGNAGRHPFEDNSIKSLKKSFLLMARSGNPDGTSKIDKEVASAYLRLWGDQDKVNSKEFKSLYAVGEDILPGYHVLPYAATAIHRRNNWAAIIKGYSKYVWSSEIYVDANRYGRYPSNGSIQINNIGGDAASGFKQEGWDWNRYPGTTVIDLPFKELEPNTELIMFRSDETFAGAVTLGNNGVFGMKLNEAKGSNADGTRENIGFPGKLKANKSVFSFGDKLICIGTGISSIDTIHPVQTNLFQNFLGDTSMPVFSSENKSISTFPYQSSMEVTGNSGKWLIDAYQNGYYILSSDKIEIRRQSQKSYNNAYSVNTGKMNPKAKNDTVTKGDYASAWIEHKKAPKEASYKYVIYPGLQRDAVNSFENKVKNDKSYQVIRADNVAHIVKDNETSTTGFVIFDTAKELDDAILESVSVPSLVMIKNEATTITISAVQPDLNFVEKDKKFNNYSMPVELTITLKGKWKLKQNLMVKSIWVAGNNTVITMECRHGFSNQIDLMK
ncbi:chondroitin-sulfate-ABC endolyase/exolyase [Pseudarcicella hirudinis]|uniref:Chondroitin-sulfate-ABC endolyase/exolyase n=1 Tax=Pseudarcicella hirudinis TaxID=1079859 RepID=A0A1I5TWX7_9BACT|nr:chondroitinase family polysaccharide lyase [Pseudarcicella hirudinis]SFP87097.1 chondroitin-sulfate-ABC endolyase/exolyase [Pseudarcicella hirudinis]